MHLSELIANIEGLELVNVAEKEVEVIKVTFDSREVQKDYMFVAMRGLNNDGTEYIDEAISKGASVILTYNDVEVTGDVAVVKTDNPRKALSIIASNFYPEQVEHIVAVTGTNGKTSTVSFCRQIWDMLGFVSASLGTVGVRSDKYNTEGSLTLPDAITLHSDIAVLKQNGVNHLALEASSQGMDQFRLDGVKIKAAAFSNLTQDHLDYHGTMDGYFKTKARLFSDLLVQEQGIAVINTDDEYSQRFIDVCKDSNLQILEYGEKAKDIKLLEHHMLPEGQAIKLEVL